MQISTDNFIPDSAPLKLSLFLGVWIIRLTSKVIPYLNTWGFPTLYTKNRPPEKLTEQYLCFLAVQLLDFTIYLCTVLWIPSCFRMEFYDNNKNKILTSADRSPFSNCQQIESLSRLLWLANQSLHH